MGRVNRTWTTLTTYEFARESSELVMFDVLEDEVPITTFKVQAQPRGDRPDPEAWADPVALSNGERGFLVAGLPPGTHTVWIKVLSNPETPIGEACHVRIT